MSFGLRKGHCAVCGAHMRVNEKRAQYGPFATHIDCEPTCPLCEEAIEPPPLGKAHTVAAWCGKPAHTACKP